MGFIDLPEGEAVSPGDTIQTELTIISDPARKPEFSVDREWHIQEGEKVVALGTIVEALNPVA